MIPEPAIVLIVDIQRFKGETEGRNAVPVRAVSVMPGSVSLAAILLLLYRRSRRNWVFASESRSGKTT